MSDIAPDQLDFDLSFDPIATNTSECREPGIYRDMPFEEYAAMRAFNSGVVKWGFVTIKHMRAALEGRLKSEDTKDRKLGRAIHQRVLEPDRPLVVATQCTAMKKDGTRCSNLGYLKSFDGGWYCGVKGHAPASAIEPLDYVSEEEAARIEKIVAALHDHPAMPMLRQNGWSEVSIVWEFEGMLLKGRLDRYAEGPPPVVLDLKKIQVGKGSRDECQKTIVKMGYHRQAAIYAKGVQFHTGLLPSVIWLFQEDSEPYDTQIIIATDEEMELAWREVAERLRVFRRCQAEDKYPGYVKLDHDGKILGEPGACPAWWLKDKREMQR